MNRPLTQREANLMFAAMDEARSDRRYEEAMKLQEIETKIRELEQEYKTHYAVFEDHDCSEEPSCGRCMEAAFYCEQLEAQICELTYLREEVIGE